MIESQLRALFRQMADGEPGPSRVNTELAHRSGRARLRWYRVGVAATPVLAAAVVVAMIGAVSTFGAGSPGPPDAARASAGAPGSPAAPRHFNALIPYASFGWLPASRHLTMVTTGAAAESFEVGSEGSDNFVGLDVYLPGKCDHSSTQLVALLHHHQHPQLACTLSWGANGGNPTLTNAVTAVAPAVNGHQAFWATPACNTNQCDPGAPGGSILMWNYAPGAWAVLADRTQVQALRIADKIAFGPGVSQPIRFPAQLTGVPSDWQVATVQSGWVAGRLTARQWYAGRAASAPSLIIGPASAGGSGCELEPASADRNEIVNGYHVTTATTRQGSQICAPDADGLHVYIFTGAGVTPDALAIFAHHLRLLGPDPARWTTRPIG